MSTYRIGPMIIRGTLKEKLIEVIRGKACPLKVSEYMNFVLTNPSQGFYMNNDVLGVKGHFTTSPEVSQIFGEIYGSWILQEWRRFKCPEPLKLVELGPGRGTLMADILRTIKALEPSQKDSIQVGLVEISPHMKTLQEKTLKEQDPGIIRRTQWFSTIQALSNLENNGFTAYIAHEFLDALPINKFVRLPKTGMWRELMIDYNEQQELIFTIGNKPSMIAKMFIPPDTKCDHFELSLEGTSHLQRVAKRLSEAGTGCMLVCDYGFEADPDEGLDREQLDPKIPVRSKRDTFRAFKSHQTWPPLKDPGDADLTADVDFNFLKQHLKGRAVTFGSVEQREFLVRCGFEARLGVLLANSNVEHEREQLISGAHMLLEDMGKRYRFLAMFPNGTEHLFDNDPPAGFEHG